MPAMPFASESQVSMLTCCTLMTSWPWCSATVYQMVTSSAALDTYLRYHYEQGLSARRWTVEEIFDPHLLDT